MIFLQNLLFESNCYIVLDFHQNTLSFTRNVSLFIFGTKSSDYIMSLLPSEYIPAEHPHVEFFYMYIIWNT